MQGNILPEQCGAISCRNNILPEQYLAGTIQGSADKETLKVVTFSKLTAL